MIWIVRRASKKPCEFFLRCQKDVFYGVQVYKKPLGSFCCSTCAFKTLPNTFCSPKDLWNPHQMPFIAPRAFKTTHRGSSTSNIPSLTPLTVHSTTSCAPKCSGCWFLLQRSLRRSISLKRLHHSGQMAHPIGKVLILATRWNVSQHFPMVPECF